jgi:hypothetical protein
MKPNSFFTRSTNLSLAMARQELEEGPTFEADDAAFLNGLPK